METSETKSQGEIGQASLPPRGWNSYDSFCWTISEEEFLKNAELVALRLKAHGYQYVVVDFLWYRKKIEGAYTDSYGYDVIDKWGRMLPDPGRWPSSRGGKGFSEVAQKVHSMGLKFGIHVMRGLSKQAFNANTLILDTATGKAYEEAGRQWRAQDIGIKERACAWMTNGFMSVNTKLGAGRAFLRSLYQQYADWGVDFVKHDCVFGDDLDLDEITVVSEVLNGLKRPIVYSLSPGTNAKPTMAKDISGLVNMYRVTGDDWDDWNDVSAHFNVARDFSAANLVGVKGLKGKSWPDLDMLPLGWLTDAGSNLGPHRNCRLNLDEQRTQVTLWSMVRSPFIFGGDMRRLDDTTFNLLTNPTLLEINWFSSNNMEFRYVTGSLSSPGKHGLTHNSKNEGKTSVLETRVLVLRSCKDVKANGWSTKVLDNDVAQVCWEESSNNRTSPFCLYKRKAASASEGVMVYNHQSHGKLHLLVTERTELCFSASSNRKLTSKESSRGSFSRCRSHANQMWELNNNGTLKNSYSGLCASLDIVKASSGGVRSWLATGRRGEIYLAFFNLNNQVTDMSAKISDIAKAIPARRRSSNVTTCTAREVWSATNLGAIKDSVSMSVKAHGCALFVLHCN
ncbi:PREDICTED: uncharacterized protein LOC109235602 isoform X2 [Nicotiana attenuata]|uniref:uncharacterized protein LOC109235602 isoform X2 n=1 Tax=Nicotiana attenuata TaxID=49451 RepID=UPI0009053B08|nr:PREDICTED: uncharacterized protein LOC109235602 isoform X2 [Nicotiana attenuata]